ncbi:MAG TPA: nitroreductase family protein [Candidatus Syntrophosphaera sp.]|nr:nitroreductase family protein [Candidatus Syntrophosphaera sp.]
MLHDLIVKNRSYRRFAENQRLRREDLLALLNNARLSPSAMNRQSLRYRLVYTKEECDLVFPHTRWGGYLKTWPGPAPGQRPAAYLIMCLPREAGPMQFIDTGIAAQSILLAAAEQAWGGCMLGSVNKDEVRRTFRLPEELEIALVIALGVPAEQVVLDPARADGSIEYWRDGEDIHHVPKLDLEDLLIPEV